MNIRIATAMLVTALVISACDAAGTSPSAAPSASPPAIAPPANQGLDVLTYKGDAGRHSLHPGPAIEVEPRVLWSDPATVGFNASPLVRDGIAYGIDGQVVRAWDLATGVRRDWEIPLPTMPDGSATIAGDLYYIVTDDGVLHAYRLADGQQAWEADGVNGGSIAIDDGLLVVGAEPEGVVAFDATTGEQRWSAGGGAVVATSLGGGHAYGSGTGKLTAIDANGNEKRTIDLHAERTLTPSVDDDAIRVIADEAPGGDMLLGFDPNLTELWRYEIDEGNLGSHTVTPDRIVLTISLPTKIISIDRATRQLEWEQEFPGTERVAISIVADGFVHAIVSGVGLVALDEATGDIAWTWEYDGWYPYGVTVSDGIILVAPDGDLGFTELVALAAPEDPRHALVPAPASAGAPGVHPFALAGQRLIDPEGFFLGMARGPDGTIYLADAAKHRVVIVPPDGGAPTFWDRRGADPGEFDFTVVAANSQATGVAVSPDGTRIAVGDGGNRRVQVFDAAGDVKRVIGRLGNDDGQFVNPCCPAIDDAGHLFVVDTQRGDIQKFHLETGAHLLTFGRPGDGNGELFTPGMPAIAGDELLIGEFDNRRVSVFSTDGRWLRNHGSRPEDGLIMRGVNEVVVDDAGRIYVHSGNTILILERDGRLVATLLPWELGFEEIEIGPFVVDRDGRQLIFSDLLGGRLITVDLDPSIWPPAA